MVYISRSCDKYRNIFWIFDMHLFLDMLSWLFFIFSVFHRFLRRPKRCAPKFYAKSRLNFCVSSVLDPIGDQILIGNTNRLSPIPGRGVGDRWRPGLCVVFRGVVLSVGALSIILQWKRQVISSLEALGVHWGTCPGCVPPCAPLGNGLISLVSRVSY